MTSMYSLAIKPDLDRLLEKLKKKNKQQYEMIFKKVAEVLKHPQHYKNLRKPLQHWKRVHIDKSFDLIFNII